MKATTLKWGGIVFCLLFLSCDKSPTEYGVSPDVYFQTGRVYRYNWSSTIRDSLGNVLYQVTDTAMLMVESATATVDTLRNLVKVVVTSRSGQSTVYYKNTASALTEVAYEAYAGPLVQPSIKGTKGIALASVPSMVFSIPAVIQWLLDKPEVGKTDSVIVRSDPRIVYRYPLITGQQWVSFTDPFGETREVVGVEDVDASGGVQSCTVIRTELSVAPDIEWMDYVNFDGLVKRSIKIKVFLSTENPEVTGEMVEMTEQATLISVGYFQ